MIKRLLTFLTLLTGSITAFGQDFSRHEADSMTKALKKIKPGVERAGLLLNLAQYHIFKPGELPLDFDSAAAYINEAKVLNNTVNSPVVSGYQILTESYLIKERGQKEESKKLVERAIKVLESGTNKDYRGQAFYELSTYYDYTDSLQLSKRITLVEQSIECFRQARDFKRAGKSLEALGDLYGETGDFDKTIVVLKLSLSAYDSIKYQNLQGVYGLLGVAYLFQGRDYNLALFYLLKSLKTAQLVQDTSLRLCQINNYIGLLYNEIGRSDTAIEYLGNALKVAKKYNDEQSIYLLVSFMAATYNEIDQPEKALDILTQLPEKYFLTDNLSDKAAIGQCFLGSYTLLKQFSKAQAWCDTLLGIAGKKISTLSKSNIYRLAANYYFSIKQFPKARYYLEKSSDLVNKINRENGRIQNLRLLYKIDSAQRNFQPAFANLLLYKAKTDSVSSVRKARQFQVLGVEYEVGMKEDSIRLKDKDILLLTQTNSLQQANLRQASLIKNITIAGIIFAVIIIGLLYRQYRHKQKSNNTITQKNQQLQHYLTEKEWLLKEIHHRVKNNLQIVMSLLNSQSAYIDNEPALTAIHDSQHRVHAMSLIHQKLYNSENLSSIDMSLYIRELASYLADSFNTGQQIRFELAIEPLAMDVSQAIPLGLILNEAITNSIKYAFPNDREGIINITLSNTSDNQYLLEISDNGIGIPSQLKNKKIGSLGMSLMAGLSEDLDGSFSIENNNGTVIRILFVHDMSAKRPDSLIPSFATSN